MLSILYPKEDYTAADVAVRVQALAAGEGQKIQVIAKHFGRNPLEVEKQLKRTKIALFIACDQVKLDDNSQQELDILLKKHCKIICIVPQKFESLPENEDNIEKYTYTQGDARSFADTAQNFVKKLKDFQISSPPAKKNNDISLLIAGGLLVAGIIFLVNLNKKSGEEIS